MAPLAEKYSLRHAVLNLGYAALGSLREVEVLKGLRRVLARDRRNRHRAHIDPVARIPGCMTWPTYSMICGGSWPA